MLTGRTWSDRQPMPGGRGGDMARVTGELPGTRYVYQVGQDLTDPEGDVRLVVTSDGSGKTWASSATAAECRDQGTDVWGLLIARLLPSGGAGDR